MIEEEFLGELPVEELPRPTEKLYNAKAVAICAFVGGPYLLAKNYFRVGEEEAVHDFLGQYVRKQVLIEQSK